MKTTSVRGWRRAAIALGGVAGLGLSLLGPVGPASAAPSCQIKGTWHQTTEQIGSTFFTITADPKVEWNAQESGIGNVPGKATLVGNELTIRWEKGDYAGVYSWKLDAQCNGSGSLVFTKTAPGDGRTGPYASTVKGPSPVESAKPAPSDCPRSGDRSTCYKPVPVSVAPGGTAIAASPTTPRKTNEMIVEIADVFAANEAGLRALLPTLSNKKKLLTCATFGALAHELSGGVPTDLVDDLDPDAVYASLQVALTQMCFQIVEELAHAAQGARETRANACSVGNVAVPVRVVRTGAGYVVKIVGNTKPGVTNPLRLSCTASGDDLSIRVRTRSTKQRLSDYLGGSRASIGLQSSADPNSGAAPSQATVSFQRPS